MISTVNLLTEITYVANSVRSWQAWCWNGLKNNIKIFLLTLKKFLLIILIITKCYVKKIKIKKPHNSKNKMNLKLMIFFHFLAIQTHIQNLRTLQQSINTHKLRLHKLTVHTFAYSLIHNNSIITGYKPTYNSQSWNLKIQRNSTKAQEI